MDDLSPWVRAWLAKHEFDGVGYPEALRRLIRDADAEASRPSVQRAIWSWWRVYAKTRSTGDAAPDAPGVGGR